MKQFVMALLYFKERLQPSLPFQRMCLGKYMTEGKWVSLFSKLQNPFNWRNNQKCIYQEREKGRRKYKEVLISVVSTLASKIYQYKLHSPIDTQEKGFSIDSNKIKISTHCQQRKQEEEKK